MALWLRVLDTFAKDPVLFTSTPWQIITFCTSGSKESNALFRSLQALGTHVKP